MFLSFFGHNFPSLLLFNLHHSSIPNDAYDMYIYIYMYIRSIYHTALPNVSPQAHIQKEYVSKEPK